MQLQENTESVLDGEEPSAPVRPMSATGARRRRFFVPVVAVATIVGALWLREYLAVGRPVAQAIEADSRNSGIELIAHFKYRVVASILVMDLRGVVTASPADLFRTLFQAADALHARQRAFDKVEIARNGHAVFVINDSEFDEIGGSFGAGENPLYLLRTFPQKLRRPDGSQPFSEWEGGILGVAMRQLEDVTKAASAWVDGRQ
jgi:hypothetical protein